MIISAYGGGTNSTAKLVECVNRGIKIDLILFSDTGAEKPHTYTYVDMFSKWLISKGYPEITIVKPTKTIIEDCQDRNALPSVAFGFKTCSDRFKIGPQRKYVNNWPPAKEAWKRGEKITRLIGYDADEAYRADKPIPDIDKKKYKNRYPLIEWDMGRDDCIDTIKNAGLCLPGKSACYICPNSQPSEIRQNAANYPELMNIAIKIESEAELTAVKGLGRKWKWGDLLKNDEMFPDGYANTPEMTCDCYDG